MIYLILGIAIALFASWNVRATFKKYSQYECDSGITAEAFAERMLRANGIYDVQIHRVKGELSDFYDPRKKILCLSESVYGSASIAAIGFAAHECGHAIQDSVEYKPMRLRGKIVKPANIGSNLSYPIILLGIMFSAPGIVNAGILLFTAVVLFHLVTLPVEFDASRRACDAMISFGTYSDEEVKAVRKVLSAAAMTYLAALLNSILTLVRLLGIAGRRR